MSEIEGLHPVLREGTKRQLVVPCPGCGDPRGLFLKALDPKAARVWREGSDMVDVTASIVKPADRKAAMDNAAGDGYWGALIPWISCTNCGYNGHYTIGEEEDPR